MRPLVTLITTAALLLHFTIGCCAHHSHDSAVDRVVVENRDILLTSHCPTHEHGHSEAPSGPMDRCPSEDCDEPGCSFVLSAETSTPDLDLKFSATLLLTEVPLASSIGTVSEASEQRSDQIAPPLRAHLLLQVILI
jgi:hypothetical protein